MDIQKLVPWNWFKDEDNSKNMVQENQRLHPLSRLQEEFNQLIESHFNSTAFSEPFFWGNANFLLKPKVDITSSSEEYLISVEVPGVNKEDMNIELVDNKLIITGEKKQDSERTEKNTHRVERCYGSFQRVISLAQDSNPENIEAEFKNGVLTIRVERKEVMKQQSNKILIK